MRELIVVVVVTGRDGSAAGFVNPVPQLFAGLEMGDVFGGQGNRFSGFGINVCTR